jgi:arylsulfatase A-like enzyme
MTGTTSSHAPAERARRFLVVVLVLLAASLAAAAVSCSKPPQQRRVYARIADLLYPGSSRARESTSQMPRTRLGGETRVVLRPKGPRFATMIHANVTLDPPPGARLEFGFGIDGAVRLRTPVDFIVSAADDAGTRVLFQETFDPKKGDEPNRWYDRTVDLPEFSGNAQIQFTTASGAIPAKAADEHRGMPVFSAGIVTVPADDGPRPPNVVLVSLDTLRADHLGIYGYQRDTSPEIDRIFSTSGIVVDRTYTQATSTLYAHTAMLTGLLPSTALAKVEQSKVIYGWVPTLAEVLRRAGYRTAAYTEDAFVSAQFGFARGFERYYEELGEKASPAPGATSDAGGMRVTPGFIATTFDRGLAWLRDHTNEQTFLFLHTYEVHSPYAPPPAYEHYFPTPADADAPRIDTDLYDREIRYTDAQVGRLVDALDELDPDHHTILIVTADHGEEFGEHGHRTHGPGLHDEVLHVPMLIRAPALLPAGQRRPGPMALVDLTPTVLDLVGVAAPADLEGRSLAAHVRNGDPIDIAPIYTEAFSPYAATYHGLDTSWISPGFAVTDWPRRLIRLRTPDGARYEGFDLEADSGEKNDLYASAPDRFADLRSLLDGYEAQRSKAGESLALTRTGKPAETPAVPALDEAHRRMLEELGYIQP